MENYLKKDEQAQQEKEHLKLAREVAEMIYEKYNPDQQNEFMQELNKMISHKYINNIEQAESALNKIKACYEVFIGTEKRA